MNTDFSVSVFFLRKNCPYAWQGQYQDKDHIRSVVFELIADDSLYIWHVFPGCAGGNNDLNVLDR